MSVVHGQVDAGGNGVRSQTPGDTMMEMYQVAAITTIGAGVLLATAISAGILDRSGPTAGYGDTLDTGAAMLAAVPGVNPGDSFNFVFRNTVAFAMTLVAGVGFELSGANTAVPASNSRLYTITCINNSPPQTYAATTINTNAVISGLTQAQVQTLTPGMGVSGTGIPASTTVLGVNSTTGTVTLSAAATASGTLVGISFFPRFNIKGLLAAPL